MKTMRKLVLAVAVAGAFGSLAGCAAAPADLSQFTPMRRVASFTYPTPPSARVVSLVRRGPPPSPAPAPVLVRYRVLARAQVEFPFGGFRADDLASLDHLVAQVRQMRSLDRVTVTGYADNIGSAYENHLISVRRALFIKALLIARGVPAGKIVVRGAGAADFVVNPASCGGNLHAREACQAPNRRAQIVAAGTAQELVPGGQ